MQLSSTFCRTQQAFHEDRANRAVLDNVRDVAGKAAIAWGVEAAVAASREARRSKLADGEQPASPADQFEDEDSPMFTKKLDRDGNDL